MASAGASEAAGAGTGVAAGALLAAAGAEDPEDGAEDGCEALLAGAADAAEAVGWEAAAPEAAGASAAGAADDDDAAGAAAGSWAAGSSGAAAPQAMSSPASRMNIPVKLSLGQPMVIMVPPSCIFVSFVDKIMPFYSRTGATSLPSSLIDSSTWSGGTRPPALTSATTMLIPSSFCRWRNWPTTSSGVPKTTRDSRTSS